MSPQATATCEIDVWRECHVCAVVFVRLVLSWQLKIAASKKTVNWSFIGRPILYCQETGSTLDLNKLVISANISHQRVWKRTVKLPWCARGQVNTDKRPIF